ncbi:MAG TPA: hypothetical protein VI759_00420 [Dehalococcoidia bacterium]|nr:hypothetical protein [Dehalococcoidia bacterium]
MLTEDWRLAAFTGYRPHIGPAEDCRRCCASHQDDLPARDVNTADAAHFLDFA